MTAPATSGTDDPGDAFERVVAEYGETLVSMAARLTGDPDGAQDVAQEAFIRLSREWRGTFTPSSQMTVWLRRTVHNLCVDASRAAARRSALHKSHARQRGSIQEPARGQGGGGIPDAAADAADALRILPARERSLVALKVYEGLSYREISAVTGIPEGTIGYLLHEAMEKLAKHLGVRRTGQKEAGR